MTSSNDSSLLNGCHTQQLDWFVEILTSHRSEFPSDRYFYDHRRIFIDEPASADFWDMGGLLKRRSDEISDLSTDNYILTYASDSKFLIRTFISKSIFNGPSSNDREPPLTYSVLDDDGTAIGASVLGTEIGKRRFDLVLAKYKFRLFYDKKSGPWLALIIEKGTVEEPSACNGHLISFESLYLENEAIYERMRTVHEDVLKNWELPNKVGTDRPDGELARNDESGAGTSQMLSALLRDGMASGSSINGVHSSENANDAGSPSKEKSMQVRDARIQTDPKMTGWISTKTLQEAAAMTYRSPPLIVLEGDGDVEVETRTNNLLDGLTITKRITITRDVGSGNHLDTTSDSVECLGTVPREEPSTSSNDRDQKRKRSVAEKAKTERKKKRKWVNVSLHGSLQDFYLPDDLKEECIGVLLEKE